MSAEVDTILRETYGWPLDCAPEQNAVEEAAGTPEQVAAQIDDWCRSVAATYVRYGIEPGSEAAYVQVRHLNFAIGVKFWRYNTRLALGLIHEIPEDKVRPAHTAQEWAENLAIGRDYLGYRNHDPASPEAALLYARAQNVPLDEAQAGLGIAWQFFLISGYDWNLDDHRGLDVRQILDNLWARQSGAPIPRLPVVRRN